MERLKPRDEVLLPDVRYRNRINLDHSTDKVEEMTIDTIYDELETVRLSYTAPDAVRSHFEIARNLIVYSWFVYSFNVVAAMQAFASLEMALRDITGEEETAFKNLLDKVFKGRKLVSAFGPPIELSKAISKLRNDLAHGGPTLHGQGLALVGMCADLINELYP
jgi:hypothetical protein